MSPKKPVEDLGILCLKTTTDLTLDIIKQHGEESVNELREYFRKVPKNLCDKILLGILDVTPLSSFSKWVSFCVFEYRCSRFDCRMLSPRFHERFADNLEGALHLNLTDIQTAREGIFLSSNIPWVYGEKGESIYTGFKGLNVGGGVPFEDTIINEKTLRKLIKRCPNLRSLVIPNLATDKVLKEVKNLKNLEFLDISLNAILSKTGLEYLSNETLQVLSIGTPLTYSIANYEGYDTLIEILRQLPNLIEIRTYEYTGRALLDLKQPYISKLKVISDCDTSFEQMDAIISVCPDLEELFLEDPDDDVFDKLGELRGLKKLKVKKFCEKPVTIKLKSLTLLTLEVKQVMVDIANLCLTLENFLARSCFIYNSIEEEICFRNLRVMEFIDCNIKKDVVMPLLEYCDLLQRLAVSNDMGLTDLDIRILCQNKNLKNLEELWLSLARNLTSDSVILLMNHCDKLRVLGTLNGWNIEKVEVNYLRSANNQNLVENAEYCQK